MIAACAGGTLIGQVRIPGPGGKAAGGSPTSASDDFNRADSGTLGANWTDDAAGIGISSNKANGTSGNQGSHYSAIVWSPDHVSTVTFATVPSTGCHGPAARGGSSNFYWAVYCGGQVYMECIRSGSTRSLTGGIPVSLSNGDTLGLRVTGTGATVSLVLLQNGSNITPGGVVTDIDTDRLVTGSPGIGIQDNGAFIDSWAGSNYP